MARLLDVDTDFGLQRIFHDGDGGTVTIETRQDVEALIEQNKALANVAQPKVGEEFRRVASIPLNVFFDLKRKGILDDKAAFKRWLNDRDNRFFRTTMERV